MRQLRQGHAYEWAYRKLTTIGEACRAIGRETLRSTLTWAMERPLQLAGQLLVQFLLTQGQVVAGRLLGQTRRHASHRVQPGQPAREELTAHQHSHPTLSLLHGV
jgi:hypothetical protein